MGRARDLIAPTGSFVQLACRYWFDVFPFVCREARFWTGRASHIPDPLLRRIALDSLQRKRGNIEGAGAFAALVPRPQRALVTRMLIAWQAAYDYVDTVAEQPNVDREANGRQLHLALLAAFEPGQCHGDYYAHQDRRDDGGYLEELVDAVRSAFASLPSRSVVAAPVQRAARRIVDYQSLNQHDDRALARWANAETPVDTDLYWWETAASGASSLAVLALLAIAPDPRASAGHITAIERAYFPWIGALHTLLDSLVDLQEDAAAGQTSLLTHYGSAEDAAKRMQLLATRSLRTARTLPCGRQHTLILAAMASLYLSAPEAASSTAKVVSQGVAQALGPLMSPSMAVLGLRRAARGDPLRRALVPAIKRAGEMISAQGAGIMPAGLLQSAGAGSSFVADAVPSRQERGH